MNAWSFRKTAVVALQQVALAAVLFVLLLAWLHIPDANAFEVLASVVIAVLIAAVGGAGESATALRLVLRPVTLRRLLAGAGVVVVAALLWFAVAGGLDHLNAKTPLWAGYFNSRFPASLRNVFSYGHLVLWFTWAYNALRWIVGGLLAAAAFAVVTCDAPLRGLASILRSARFWLSLLLLALIGSVGIDALLSWTPGHGLMVEAASLALRMVLAIVVSALAIAMLMRAMAWAVLRVQPVGTAEPVTSQLRTDDMP